MKLNRWFLPPVLALVFGLLLTGTVMAVLDLEGPVGSSRTIWVKDHKKTLLLLLRKKSMKRSLSTL